MTTSDSKQRIREIVQSVAEERHISFDEALRLMLDVASELIEQEEREKMLIKELAAIVHQNAVKHGWWDEEREMPELLALIHSEWSEALEEARAGRPLVWYQPDAKLACCAKSKCGGHIDGALCHGPSGFISPCPAGKKPEGIAVELIDGCIRILDLMGREGVDFLEPDTGEPSSIGDLLEKRAAAKPEELPKDVPTLVAWLHVFTSQTMLDAEEGKETPEVNLVAALSVALSWVKMQGIDPVKLLLEKHEYNKGRPYKHGKKF